MHGNLFHNIFRLTDNLYLSGYLFNSEQQQRLY